MASLAVKYRPQYFDEVCSQESIIKILQRQIELEEPKNCYLFCGPSGCGKTTLARIFAYELNMYKDSQGNILSSEPIEIDGASNNGVDNVREIIESARERSLNGKYKIYIIDECHMITVQGWNAFLKCIEEPPKYTIFMFCTTDSQRVPATVMNRVMRFNLTKVNTEKIAERLSFICNNEGFTNYKESCEYLAKLSNGGMRDAISLLEKCAGYSTQLSIENVLKSIGNFSYKTMFDLTNALIDGNETTVIEIINSIYDSGADLRLFIDNYLEFVLDLNMYCLFHNINNTKIPYTMENDVKYCTDLDGSNKYYSMLSNKLLDLHVKCKNDTMIKTTIIIVLLNICRGVKL